MSGRASRVRVCAPERAPFPLPFPVRVAKQGHYDINQFYLGIDKIARLSKDRDAEQSAVQRVEQGSREVAVATGLDALGIGLDHGVQPVAGGRGCPGVRFRIEDRGMRVLELFFPVLRSAGP